MKKISAMDDKIDKTTPAPKTRNAPLNPLNVNDGGFNLDRP